MATPSGSQKRRKLKAADELDANNTASNQCPQLDRKIPEC